MRTLEEQCPGLGWTMKELLGKSAGQCRAMGFEIPAAVADTRVLAEVPRQNDYAVDLSTHVADGARVVSAETRGVGGVRECLCVGVNWARAVLYGTKPDWKPAPRPDCAVCKGTGVSTRADHNASLKE